MSASMLNVGKPSNTLYTDEFIPLFIHTLTCSGKRVTFGYTKFAITT